MSPFQGWRRDARRALSLVEVVVSTLIVGVMIVAALNSLGAATRSSLSSANRAIALGLADELMVEILHTAYQDLNTYHNWDEELEDDRAGWRRRATVERVAPNNPTQTSAADQGAKRVRVTVEYRDQVLAEQVAIRTNSDE